MILEFVAALAFASGVVKGAAAEVAPSRAGDLERARTEYVGKSLAFSRTARDAANRFIDAQVPKAAAMSREEFLLCVMALTAYADNGHDGLNDEDGSWFPEARLPLRMIWFKDAWVVARAAPEHAELVGARVLKVEGLSSAALVERLRRYVGGTDGYRRWDGEWLVENAGMLHAMGLARRTDALEFELKLADGRRVRRTIAYVPNEAVPKGAGPVRTWTPDPWPGESEKGWRVATAASVPLYLEEGAKAHRVRTLPALGAVYVQFRTHLDAPDETMAAFTQAVDAAIASAQPKHLIVDLRFDTGGNADLTRDWVRGVVTRIPGTIYVLTGPYTFSAGIVTAGAFKHDAASHVRIVGDDVGDRLRFTSEGANTCLPYSHYCPHVTTGRWDLARGCAGEPGCYGDKYAVTVGSLAPDVRAPLDAAAWLAGRDPALEVVSAELKRR